MTCFKRFLPASVFVAACSPVPLVASPGQADGSDIPYVLLISIDGVHALDSSIAQRE